MAEGRGTSNIIRAEGANHPSIISVGLEREMFVLIPLGDIIPVWGALSKKAKSVSACDGLPTVPGKLPSVVTEGNGIAAKSAGR